MCGKIEKLHPNFPHQKQALLGTLKQLARYDFIASGLKTYEDSCEKCLHQSEIFTTDGLETRLFGKDDQF